MKVQEIISEEWSLNPLNWGKTPDADLLKAAPSWAGKLGVRRLANEQAAAAMEQRMGALSAAAKIIGFFYITVDLYQNLDELEQAYNKGTIQSDKYKTAHEAYVGLWMTQLMVPWLVRILRIEKIVSLLVRFVLAVASMGATAITGGALAPAVLAGVVVEQSVFTGIQYFLTSDTFKNWAKDYMVAFATIGYIPDELFNQLRGYISKIPGIDKIMKNPGDTFYQSQDKNRPADVRAKDKLEVDGNAGSVFGSVRDDPTAVIISNLRVDDGNGGVNKAMVGPDVDAYVRLHPEDPMVQKFLKLKK